MKEKATNHKSQTFPSLSKRKLWGIEIDIRSPRSVYITIGDYIYHIDDSTGEQIIDKWHKSDEQ